MQDFSSRARTDLNYQTSLKQTYEVSATFGPRKSDHHVSLTKREIERKPHENRLTKPQIN